MVESSHKFSSWAWECEWGHYAFDFEGEQEALEDFKRHDCNRSM